MSHSNKTELPSAHASQIPATATEIASKLDQILHAILPLHELLQAQEELDEGLTLRLKEMLEKLSMIANHLQLSSEALNRLAHTEHLPPAQNKVFNALNARLDHLDGRITAVQGDLQILMSWLGAASLGHTIEPSSSGKS